MSGCFALLRCSLRPTARTKSPKVLGGAKRAQGKGGSKAAVFVLRCDPFQHSNTPTLYFMESAKMTRKRKRDSDPPETAPETTATAQSGRVNEAGRAPEGETGSDMDLDVTDVQNNAHSMLSAARKRSKTKRKNTQGRGPLAPKPKIIKLNPARPYPTVPTSSSATVPKSRRAEGRNKICVTRRTELGSYLRQCRDVLTKDGYVHVKPEFTYTLIVRAVTRSSTCLQWAQRFRMQPCSQLPLFGSYRILRTK